MGKAKVKNAKDEARFKIFGFGSAGGNILNALLTDVSKEFLFYFDTDNSSLESSIIANKFLIGQNKCLGMGTNTDTRAARAVFLEELTLFERLVRDNVYYIIIGGFGGGTFSGMSVEISKLLFDKNKKFFLIGSYPLNFEGRIREANSVSSISEINAITDKLVLIKNEELKAYFGNLSAAELFRRLDSIIVEAIKEIVLSHDIKSPSKKDKKQYSFNGKIEDSISNIKKYIEENDYLVSSLNSKYIIADTNQELLKAINVNPDFVFSLSPRKFEELVSYIYELAGHKTELTKSSRDDGVSTP